jgi:Bacteriophage HK97-gp10, putative tail-component
MALKDWKVDEKALDQSLQDPRLAAALRASAQLGLEYAQGIAPVFMGRYRDSLFVYETTDDNGNLVTGVGTNSPYWHLIEYGSPWNGPLRVLANAAMAATGGKAEPR